MKKIMTLQEKKARAGIVAMEGNFGLAPWCRRAVEKKQIVLEEHACATLTDLGEVPVAFVVLREGARADAAGLQALVGDRLSRIYVPAEVRFVASLPENSVGKDDRKALERAVVAAPLE